MAVKNNSIQNTHARRQTVRKMNIEQEPTINTTSMKPSVTLSTAHRVTNLLHQNSTV